MDPKGEEPSAAYCRPRATANHKAEPAIPIDAMYLVRLAKRMLDRLGVRRVDMFHYFRFHWKGVFPIATLCSGTDAPILAWRAFLTASSDVLGITCEAQHLFSCEENEAKAAFIMKAFPNVPVFENVTSLPIGAAAVHGSSAQEIVPKIAGSIMAGIPCTSASALNPHSSTDDNRACVAAGTMATGQVFQGLTAYLDRIGKPCMVTLENVLTLSRKPAQDSKSNLDTILQKLRERRFWTMAFHLDPRDFGSCQCRPRLWIPALDMDAMLISPEAATQAAISIMNSLVGSQQASVSEYLLSADDPLVASSQIEHVVAALVKDGEVEEALWHSGGIMPAKRGLKRKRNPGRWPERHVREFERRGLCLLDVHEWAKSDAAAKITSAPGWRSLSERQRDILSLAMVEFDAKNSTGPRDLANCSLELSQNCGRQKLRYGSVSTITPRGQQFLMGRKRVMHYIEAFRFQGI